MMGVWKWETHTHTDKHTKTAKAKKRANDGKGREKMAGCVRMVPQRRAANRGIGGRQEK